MCVAQISRRNSEVALEFNKGMLRKSPGKKEQKKVITFVTKHLLKNVYNGAPRIKKYPKGL